MSEAELAIIRRAYAKQIMGPFGLSDARLEAAFAELWREDFLGPGPWQLAPGPKGYYSAPSADPVYLYQDALIGIKAEKELNNGQPSFLAFLISLGRLQEGEHAVHIGAGLGYYTAIIARLVDPGGRVTAIEYEPDLAERAAMNLSRYSGVRVIAGDGSKMPLDAADAIFVNAGTTGPTDSWLSALKEGGRLILPLTTKFTLEDAYPMTQGAIFLIERCGEDYSARWMSTTGIYPCVGARDDLSEKALAAAFKNGGQDKVTRLYRTDNMPEEQCWVRTAGWSLAYH